MSRNWKKNHAAMLVYMVFRCREGKIKKIGQRGGTPRGRRHAPTVANQLIPTVEGEIKRASVGGGCIANLRGGEVKATYFPGVRSCQ